MTPEEFVKNPWASGSVHAAYARSFLHMRPAPEYASGEVVLASTYRNVGFDADAVSEGKVPSLGREFQKRLDKGQRPLAAASESGIDPEVWRRVVTGTLRSPKQPNQTAKRFLQISPVVPDAALYSLSARLSANSWNPGALVAKVVQFGEPHFTDAQELWNSLFHALSVDDDDDIWARFLQQEFMAWRVPSLRNAWTQPRQLDLDETVTHWHCGDNPTPAGRFTKDLRAIISLKRHLTRRQWVSMIEALLRLGIASHVLWVCRANSVCFNILKGVVAGNPASTTEDAMTQFGVGEGFWRYGQLAAGTIAQAATDFVKARAGISLLLYQLEEVVGCDAIVGGLANCTTIAALSVLIEKNRDKFDRERFQRNFQGAIEADPRLVAGKKGISSNVKEFLRHVLGQRQTAEPGLDSYDQGFFLAKRGSYRSAPWTVALGPVSVLALVHACTHTARWPCTVDDFCRHLAEYGIEIQAHDVQLSPLGQTLRNLGLILDSPDAEGGMVVVNPFHLITDEATTV